MRQWVLLIVPENPFHQVRSNEHGLPFNTLRLSLSFPSWWERNVRSVIIARLKIQQLPVLHLGGWTRYFSFTTSKWLLLHLCLNRVLILLWLIHRLMLVCSLCDYSCLYCQCETSSCSLFYINLYFPLPFPF